MYGPSRYEYATLSTIVVDPIQAASRQQETHKECMTYAKKTAGSLVTVTVTDLLIGARYT